MQYFQSCVTQVRSQGSKTKAGLRLSTYTTKLANWPITDGPDDIVA